MMRKISLSIIILNIVEAICYFTPFCLNEEYWKYQESIVYHGIASHEWSTGINIFNVYTLFGKPLAILLFCITIVTAVIYFLNILNCGSVLLKKGWIVSIVHMAVMILFLVYVCNFATIESISYKYTYAFNWMFFVIIAINVVSLVLALFIKFGKMSITSTEQKGYPKNSNKDSIDDILAYKELLDSGVLTQEEFDNKKKQILNL